MMLGMLVSAWTAQGAPTVVQTISLHPGWNAVFLEVQPDPSESGQVFGGLAVERVLMWNGQNERVLAIAAPDDIPSRANEWLSYYPPGQVLNSLSTLHAVLAGHAYLIKLKGNANVDWTVSGTCPYRAKQWVDESFNLAGFFVDPSSGPTFQTLFEPSAAHAGQPIYRLDASGAWVKVADPATERLRKGEAFWVYTKGVSDYQGPLRVTLEQGNGLDYGRSLSETVLRLKNETSSAQTYTLTPKALDGAPAVPLSWFDFASQTWKPLDAPLSLPAQAQEQLSVRLAVRRVDISGAAAGAKAVPDTPTVSQSLLAVNDGGGIVYPLSVKADPGTRTGLWVGTVTLNQVSEHVSSKPLTQPTNAAAPFQFRIILHVDSSGNVKLLDHVTELITPQTPATVPWPPTTPTTPTAPETPPTPLLLTRDLTSDEMSQNIVRRITAPVFALPVPSSLAANDTTGTDTSFGTSLQRSPIAVTQAASAPFSTVNVPFTARIFLYRDDPLNPFLHRYHPDHDDLEGVNRNTITLSSNFESYTVQRDLSLTFLATDPDGQNPPGWNDSVLGGTYQETIQGLMAATRTIQGVDTPQQNSITVKGTFRLNHLSDVGSLN